MENNQKLLQVLDDKRLFVHAYELGDPQPDQRHTHYVMNDNGNIVHSGTYKTVESFAYQYKGDNK